MIRKETACPLDCPDACSLELTSHEGRIESLRASPRNPTTKGFICSKVASYGDHVHSDERVLTPLIRTGPKGDALFRVASWDEATDLITARLLAVRDQHGGEAILPLHYGGSNGALSDGLLDQRFFRRMGASRLAKTVCAAATGSAAMGLYGKMAGVPYHDYPEARLIVVWGCNPSATGIHLVPFIKDAQKKGARLVVIDPRRTPLARVADLHLALRPGTDLVIALALIRWLVENGHHDDGFLAAHTTGFEALRERSAPWTLAAAAAEADVSPEDLERFAQLYVDASPALIRCGWGPERNRNGGSAIAAILALPAVAGKFGVRGGGYTLSNSGMWTLDREGAIGTPPTNTRIINMNRVGAALTEGTPRIHSVFVFNCNPLSTLPRQDLVRRGLERDDLFTVVHEQVMTDTCRYADVVLPATTFLEHEELANGYGATVINRIHPVIAPIGEARSNCWLFAELLRRAGLAHDGDVTDEDALTTTLLGGLADGERVSEAVTRDGTALHILGESYVQMRDVFPNTRDRKIHLFPEALNDEAAGGLYRYQADPATEATPLTLISPALGRTVSSSLAQLIQGLVPLRIHPDDAALRGIADGATVRVISAFAEIQCSVALDPDTRQGVVVLPKGLWDRHTRSGGTSNALCPDTLTDLGGGACFNDARVQVAPVL